MFRGISPLNLDSKGRIVMPSRYRDRVREEADGCLILTIDTEEPCLLLYMLKDWQEIEKKVSALPSFNKAARRIQRLLVGHATDVDMDANGRMLVAPALRQYAQLEKKVVLVGQGAKFELWNESTWEAKRDEWLEEANGDLEGMPEELLNLSI
ncbi:MAG: cell division/cell wall cluster transcriptional repressor MraZ [Gammaproteobacteria bacterium]|nr:MAG: cell division/cell wall cluster transcriptional repressor MraZ [Gammaproteobacteria bacterium]